jgi:hypothetical protein
MKICTSSVLCLAALAIGLFSPLACLADEAVQAPAAKNKAVESLVMKKLNEIIIPLIDFEDCSLEEAIDFMSSRVRELDTAEKNPANRGISFIIRKPVVQAKQLEEAAAGGLLLEDQGGPRIRELRLANVPAGSALKYMCMLTNMKLSIGERGIEVSPSINGDLGLAGEVDAQAKAQLQQRIKELIIPVIDFENVTIDEAVDFLRMKAKEMEPQKGLNFIIMRKDGDRESPRIGKLKLQNATMESLLREFCKQTKHTFVVHEAAIILSPVEEQQEKKNSIGGKEE